MTALQKSLHFKTGRREDVTSFHFVPHAQNQPPGIHLDRTGGGSCHSFCVGGPFISRNTKQRATGTQRMQCTNRLKFSLWGCICITMYAKLRHRHKCLAWTARPCIAGGFCFCHTWNMWSCMNNYISTKRGTANTTSCPTKRRFGILFASVPNNSVKKRKSTCNVLTDYQLVTGPQTPFAGSAKSTNFDA